jgi:uncharacterized membrane protein
MKKEPHSFGEIVETHPYSDEDKPDRGLERLIFFSDGIFAVAITLLILGIHLPEDVGSFNNAQLASSLLGLWQQYLAYVISFLVVGLIWLSHHRKFGFIKHYDRTLLILDLLLMMVVAFIPFPSSILSVNSNSVATIFYASTMIIAALANVLIWWYASRKANLIDKSVSEKQIRKEFAIPLSTAAIFLVSIGASFLNPDISKLIWILIWPVAAYIQRR